MLRHGYHGALDIVGAAVQRKDDVNSRGRVRAVAFNSNMDANSDYHYAFVLLIESEDGSLIAVEHHQVIVIPSA